MWNKEALHNLIQEKLRDHKLIVVANREPYTHRFVRRRIECIQPASGMATALDPIIRSQLQADLKEIFQRLKKTVLLVTHDMSEAAYLGDEIALMREGRILQRGPVRALLERPSDPFVTEFIRAQRPLWTESIEVPA